MELVSLDELMSDQEYVDIIRESEDLIQENKVRAHRIHARTSDIKAMGTQTVATLKIQGDKINTIDKTLGTINEDLTEGDRQLTSISSIFGAMKNKFIGRKKLKHRSDIIPRHQDSGITPEKIKSEASLTRDLMRQGAFDHLSSDARHDLEDNETTLDRIADDLKDIREISISIGHELKAHNRALASVSESTLRTECKTRKISAKTRRQF